MKYRVKFKFAHQILGYYYSEWFDELEEAKLFVKFSRMSAGTFPLQIEDENEEVV